MASSVEALAEAFEGLLNGLAAMFLLVFLDPVLGAMMKQVCWHSRRSKAYRGLPEARMVASRLLRMYWSSRGLPRLLLAPFTASSEK